MTTTTTTARTMWIDYDGGRAAAGYTGNAGDCGARAAAIADAMNWDDLNDGHSYLRCYEGINEAAKKERPGNGKRSTARNGVSRPTFDRYMKSRWWGWTATMTVGSGCKVHVRTEELPVGLLVLRLSKHYAAFYKPSPDVGYLIDTHDSSISSTSGPGDRCVYGYWWADRDIGHVQRLVKLSTPKDITA